jgi:hypothetical protein
MSATYLILTQTKAHLDMNEEKEETPRYIKILILICKIVSIVLLVELILEFFNVI